MEKPIIVYGNRALAKMLFLDARKHPDFHIRAFSVDQDFLEGSGTFMGLPQIAFEVLEYAYPPEDFDMIVLEGTSEDIKLGKPLYKKAKDKGYRLSNYFSQNSVIPEDFEFGENNVVYEQAYLGSGGKMGSGNIIRQQVYLGHDFNLGNHNILNPGVRIGGFCSIDDFCYLGLGAIVIDKIHIASKSIVGAGSVVIRNTETESRNVGNPSRKL